MDDNQPPILSHLHFSSVEANAVQISDQQYVEGFRNQGLMTKDAILGRLTAQINATLFQGREEQIENLKKNFDSIKVPSSVSEDDVVSKSKFIAFISQELGISDGSVNDGILAIYESALVYGNFPFPPETGAELTFDHLLRAIAFLWDRQTYHPGDTTLTQESFMGVSTDVGGHFGAYDGSLTSQRHRTHEDRRRLDFRTLAVKKATNNAQPNAPESSDKVSIVYFKGYVPDEGFDDTYLHLLFADDEDERGVDVVDVLRATFPEDPDPMIAPPMLCSFRGIAKDLPSQPDFLRELEIPYAKFLGWIKLLLLVQVHDMRYQPQQFRERIESLNTSAKSIVNKFTEGEGISWKTFTRVLKQEAPTLYLGGLHQIANRFLSPATHGKDA